MLSVGRNVLNHVCRQSTASNSAVTHGTPAFRGSYKLRSMPLSATATQRRHIQQHLAMAKEMSMSFWNGGKQLYANFWESRKIRARQEAGETLTRAEQRFMRQTSEDLWKLGPIVLINLLPASLVLLGLYIAAVPGALPSTIKIAAWAEKAIQGAIKAKQEGSKGVLEHVNSLVHSTPETNDYDHVLTPEIRSRISELNEKVSSNKYIQPSDITPLSKPFETVMDIVEMERPLLTAGSQLVGIATFRIIPLPFKIARLNRHFAQLSMDDKLVIGLPEGVNSLTDQELSEFLEERGIHPKDLSRKQQLRWAHDWLEMAKDPSIVPSVYLLFAACNLNAKIPSTLPSVGKNKN